MNGNDIWFAPYELKLKDFPEALARRGALIRVGNGYADLHPWPELGDLALEEELSALDAGSPTPLGFKSLFFAGLDAEARQKKVNLMNDLAAPANHLHLGRWKNQLNFSDLEKLINEKGFRRIKIKMGDFLSPEEFKQFRALIEFTKRFDELKLRIDFNYSFGERSHDFEDLFNTFTAADLDQIDFIEDPFLYEDHSWIRVQEELQIRFALDRGDHEIKIENDKREDLATPPFAVVVVKPALEDVWPVVESAARNMRRVVFTSYLDHPLGQLSAAYEAGLCLKKHPLLFEDCGLLSHMAYDPNDFSIGLKIEGTRLMGAAGTGFGFDELLEKQNWVKLR